METLKVDVEMGDYHHTTVHTVYPKQVDPERSK